MKKMLGLFATMGILLATSCSSDTGESNLPNDGMVNVSFSIGLERDLGMRDASAEGGTTRISDGTRAKKLYYAIYAYNENTKEYDKFFNIDEGTNGENPIYYEKTVTNFPYEFSCQLVKGMDYKFVFWAQSENADEYYDLSKFPNVEVKYNKNDGTSFDNNDEIRDAFCVSQHITASSVATSHTIILTRPFAQINVGMSKKLWEKVNTPVDGAYTEGTTLLHNSSMTIKSVATKFDIRENRVVNESTWSNIKYQPSTIPFMQTTISGINVSENDRYLCVDLNNDSKINGYESALTTGEAEEMFYWVSMCYVLTPDESDNQGTVVNISDISFYDEDKESTLSIPALSLENVPVRRNYRTNILYNDDLLPTIKLSINLDRDYENDYNGYGEDGEYQGVENKN